MHGIRQLSDKSPCGPARGRALHGHILVTAWGYALITDCTPTASCPRAGCFTTWSADLKKNCCFWPAPSCSMGGMGWQLFEACSASPRRQAPGGQVHSLHLKTSGAVERCWQLPETSRNWSVFDKALKLSGFQEGREDLTTMQVESGCYEVSCFVLGKASQIETTG